MTSTKAWYASKTIWAAFFTMIFTGLAFVPQLKGTLDDANEYIPTIAEKLAEVGAILGAIFTGIFRVTAKQTVTLTGK